MVPLSGGAHRRILEKESHMATLEEIEILPVDVDEEKTARWARLLTKATLITFPVGILIGVLLWATANVESLPWTGPVDPSPNYGSTGQDIAVVVWCVTFALATAFMSIRQILLAEKE